MADAVLAAPGGGAGPAPVEEQRLGPVLVLEGAPRDVHPRTARAVQSDNMRVSQTEYKWRLCGKNGLVLGI